VGAELTFAAVEMFMSAVKPVEAIGVYFDHDPFQERIESANT